MAKHLSNLSGLRVDRHGKVDVQAFKAHVAELQRQLRDIQEEIRQATGGGRGQVPTTETTGKKPFRFPTPNTATATQKVQIETSLRTATRARAADDLVTKRQLNQEVGLASTATGFMDLVSNQIVVSGNKDFGGISLQSTQYLLPGGTIYTTAIDLSGATLFQLKATGSNSNVTIHGFQTPAPNKNMLRILIWVPQISTQNLLLVQESSSVSAAERIDTLSAATGATITTTGGGAFILIYNTRVNRWTVISRTA